MRSFRLLFSLLFLLLISHKHYGQALCSQAQPVCAGSGNIFPGNNVGAGEIGPAYDCLLQQPRPSWHTLKIGASGNLSIVMSGTGNSDIDFICYGPFTSLTNVCSNLTLANRVDCGYSSSATETLNITGAVAGQYYMLLVTNFVNTIQNVIVTQSGGSGSLDCSDVCNITGITRTISSCYAPNTYSISGTVSVNGVPTVGTLTITNSAGGTPVVYTAPFPTPITYAFANLTANGSTPTVTARFSSLTTCSLTTSYTAPSTPTLNLATSSNPLCIPGSATLTASGSAGSYTWSTGATGASIVESPALPGVYGYTVSSYTTPGCIGLATRNLTVANTPTVLAFAIPGFVCSGASATLIGTGANTFTWQPGGMTGNTVGINPTVPTTYSVTGTFGACTNTATTFVNVISGPVITATTTASNSCPAQSVTLSATGAISYTWYPGGTIAPSLVVSPNVTTTYSVVGINAFGCTSTLVVTQTVSPTPNIIISPASPTLCAGSSIALSATGATSYTWNPGNLTGAAIVVSPSSNTSYTVTGSNGTCSNTAVLTVTVVPLPPVGASASTPSICSGGTVTLTGSGAATYIWNPGGLAGTNVNVSPLTTTEYTVTGNASSCTNTAVVTVSVSNGPVVSAVASPTAICPGATATLSATGAVSYTWTPGGLNTPDISVSPAVTTLYSVTGANASGCPTTVTVNLVVNALPGVGITASSLSVCAGSNVTLTAAGAISYTWNPGNLTGAGIVVTPAINTTYTVSGTSAQGCIGENTAPITVAAVPVVSATAMPALACSGSSATLTASGATNYTWNPGNITGNPVTVSPLATTVYTVTGESSGCSSSATATITTTSGPTLNVSASPALICPGGSSTLTASGAMSYTWEPGLITAGTIIVNPAATTDYTVSGTDASGCVSTSVITVSVSLPVNVVITPPSPSICAGRNATLTATGAVSYVWSPGGLTGNSIVVSPSSNTTYTAVGTDAAGCTGQGTSLVTVNANPVVGATASPTAICVGATATLSATGAASYTWNPGNAVLSDFIVSPLVTTIYTLTGNVGGCTATAVITLVVNSNPAVGALALPANICPGGTSTLAASGAVSYTWSTGALTSSVVVNPVATTIYTVTGSNGAGCRTSRSVTVTTSPAPVINVTSTSASVCAGSSATLSASGAVSYSWTPVNLTTASIVVSPLVNTTYTVRGQNAFGCFSQTVIIIAVAPVPVVGASSTPTAICNGQSATLNGTGATSYTWNPGNLTGASVIVSPAVTTNYTVSGNSAGCTASTVVAVVVNNGPAMSASASPAGICPGNSSTLSVTGTAVSYTWEPGGLVGTPVTVSPLATTVYTVTGASASGCTLSVFITVTVSSSPALIVSASSPTVCAGSNATLSASGATSYTWEPGSLSGANVIVSPLSNTTYTVTGANAFGCTSQSIIAITVVPVPVVNASATPTAICNGQSATLNGSGAASYTWNPGNLTGASVIVMPTATTVYNMTGSSSGCSSTANVTVVVNPAPVINVSASPATICINGTSTLTASGAVSYTWAPLNLTGNPITALPSVTTVYTVTGTDLTGCTATAEVTVNVNNTPTVLVTSTSPSICSGSSATLTASGATSYLWLPVNSTGTNVVVSPTSNTTYTVRGTNAAGCTVESTIAINVTPTPTISVSPTATICPGASATLTASGAASYTWNPGGLTGGSIVVNPLATTIYTVSGGSLGCTATRFVQVIVTSSPAISVNASPANICPGGSSTLTATGAISYTLQPGNITGNPFIVTPASGTTYTITGAGAGGCTATIATVVNVNPVPVLVASASSPSVCAGSNVTLTASGATSYTWNPGGFTTGTVAVIPAISTNYTVTGRNAAGCSSQSIVAVTVLPVPSLTVTGTPAAICSGASATLNASGAASYVWNPGGLTGPSVIVTPAATTVYSVTGTIAGCSSAANVTVTVGSTPALSANATPSIICPGGTSTLTASGAVSYTWNPGNLAGSSVTVSPAATTVYTVIGASATGCTATALTVVNVTSPPSVTLSASSSSICAGAVTTLTATGANSYVWNPGGLTGSIVTVSPLTSTNYTVTGSSATGCSTTAFINITVTPIPTLGSFATPPSVCSGSSSTLTATGATNYTWNPGGLTGGTVVVTPLIPTIYTVVAESNGCTNTGIVAVNVSSAPGLTVTASGNLICSGSSATLNATGTISYTWQPGGLTGSSVTVSPASTTVYTVTGSNGSGCNASTTFTLNVSPAFTVTASAAPAVICQGFTTALTAAGAISYTWHPGNTVGSTILETPMVTTTYTVDADNGSGGCITSTVVTVTVNPAPTITASAMPPVICTGNTTTLTASGAASYTWLPLFQAAASITDTPTSTTEYTVVGLSASGCPNFAIVTVTVLSAPAVGITASSATICAGSSATLTGNGAISYTWAPIAQFTESVVVTPAATSIYTLTGDNGSCSSGASSATIEIVVNAIPTVSASISSGTVCGGTPVTLTATGALNYTWSPIGLTGDIVTDNPTAPVTYTVHGSDAAGCTAQATVDVFINASPVITVATTATAVCPGGSVTLDATGAVTYSWEPVALTGATITDTPQNTTTYTVTGIDAIGCAGTETITIAVVPVPVLTVTPTHSVICANTAITLTVTGATSYTWLPSGNTGSTTVETPSVSSNYTVIGDNGGGCPVTFTVDVFTLPLPANVLASASGSITCATPSVDLTGSTTSPNVTYSWNGPLSYTSNVQNPAAVTAWGVYTLTVMFSGTGCISTATVDVPTDNSIPFVTATTSGSITCSAPSVTLNAIHTTTNPGYTWTDPAGGTSTLQTFTTSLPGVYMVTVTDLTSNCKTATFVTVGTHTSVSITASITAATCTGGSGNNDGTITVFNFGVLDKYDLVSGPTYTGTATYGSAALIPAGGVITSNLANPTTTLAYTIRLFDDAGCMKDTMLILQPTDCTPKGLGIAKDVSAATLNSDGTYNVTYTLVAKNYDTAPLTNIVLTENLVATFPAPATFTVISAPVVASINTSLVLNAGFDGSITTGITNALSILPAGKSDTIVFSVKVTANGTFGPFKNSVLGEALTSLSLTVRDSSNTGMDPDPDNDGNPMNNNVPTIITFSPNVFFGITKTGTVSARLSDNSYDIAYSIRVHNLGNDTLYNVVLKDSLFAKTIKNPAAYSIKTAPSSDGNLVANAAFDGKADINLIDPLTSRMPPGRVNTITFVINVTPDTVTVFSNSAYGNCLTKNNVVVSDTSNAGFNPDTNGNNIWNEPADNVPTVLTITNHSLFIPQGFSPNGDAINQAFVIQGLPATGDNSLTVFNRWGNKVYYKANYDNTWEGYPNVSGILGSDKLPQGTYYYILEMKGSGIKPITGFIVLEY